MSKSLHEEEIQALAQLASGWDGEGAEPPSRLAIQKAIETVRSLPEDIRVTDVEADVIGGIALWLEPAGNRPQLESGCLAWFGIRNNGKVLLALAGQQPGGPLSVTSTEDPASLFEKIRASFGGAA